MHRRKSNEMNRVPSIIQEIVIYNKPNKPVVGQEVLPCSAKLTLPNGDIILSCNKSSSENQEQPDVKDEPEECESESELCTDFDQPSQENMANPTVESINNIISGYLDEEGTEVEESIENITKEVLKLKSPVKKGLKSSKPKSPKEATSFKKPHSPSTKKSNQKTTILNFFNKIPKQTLLEQSVISSERRDSVEEFTTDDEEAAVEVTVANNSSDTTRQKRTRRIPKKYENNGIIMDDISLGHYSFEEAALPTSLKKKKYAELQIVPLYANEEPASDAQEETLQEMLEETEQEMQANEMDEEHQELAEEEELPEQKRKVPLRKSLRKRSAKQQEGKLAEQNIKREVEDGVEEMFEVGQEEGPDSDEDSRMEWVPEEYAEYKRQHVMKKSTKMHKCKFCGLEFGSYYGMRKHRALDHNDLGRDRKESTYNNNKESGEGEEESDEESRGEWMPQDYAEYKMKHSLNKQKRSQWYSCKICCAVFSNYYKLSKHKAEHESKSDPYACQQCEARFKDVETFTAHIRAHQGKDPYTCKKCSAGFQTKEELSEHEPVHILKKPPPAAKRFRCDVCGKEFRKLCDIERHTRVHTGEKPAECNICHKRFQQAHNLSKHLLTHLHVRPFQCEICNKKFGRIDVLNRHLLTHSMEKPYKCDQCSKGFIRQIQLTNHLKKVHQENMDETIGNETDSD